MDGAKQQTKGHIIFTTEDENKLEAWLLECNSPLGWPSLPFFSQYSVAHNQIHTASLYVFLFLFLFLFCSLPVLPRVDGRKVYIEKKDERKKGRERRR